MAQDSSRNESVSTAGIVCAPWLGFGHDDGHPPVSFQEYLRVRGHQNQSTSITAQERLLMYQSWLTFGLLEGVIEKHVPESVLLRKDNDGNTVVSTEAVPLIMRDWLRRFRSKVKGQKEWFQRAERALSQAYSMFRKAVLTAATTQRRPQSAKTDMSIFVIAIIGEAIDMTINQLPFDRELPVSWEFVLSAHSDHHQLMLAKGWCPFVIKMTDSVSARIYASSHEPANSLKGHAACTEAVCVANTIDSVDYTAKHQFASCECAYSKPLFENVVGILSAGQIPVVTFEASANPSIVTASASDVSYVAISHVWADGIGSTTETGLPSCQLERIAAMTKQLIPGGAFWVDALCVPGLRPMRKKAIGLMGETYRRAAKVLVLDAGIRSCPMEAPIELKLLRVLTSGWMQRLWTLQEAVLAQELVFEFEGGLLTFTDLIPKGYLVTAIQAYLIRDLYRVTKGLFTSDGADTYTIADVSKSLVARSTSRAEDETLAVASLLGVEASGLVDLSPDRRMVALLCGVRNLPANIPLLRGPKLDIPGFRWAPTSFMGECLKGRLDFGNTDAICTPEGLVSKYHFLYFSRIALEAGKECFFRESTTQRLYMTVDLTPGDHSYACNALLLSKKITEYTMEVFHCAAVLAKLDEDIGVSENRNDIRLDCDYMRALLLQVAVHDDKCQHRDTVITDARSGYLPLRII